MLDLNEASSQIFCRGRGSAPEPEAVNDFCWALMSFIQDPDQNGKHAIVHCTHGFNRTGTDLCWLAACLVPVSCLGLQGKLGTATLKHSGSDDAGHFTHSPGCDVQHLQGT